MLLEPIQNLLVWESTAQGNPTNTILNARSRSSCSASQATLANGNEVPGEAAQTLVTALERNVKHEGVGVTVNATARNSVPI
jgi:hypothetical protein